MCDHFCFQRQTENVVIPTCGHHFIQLGQICRFFVVKFELLNNIQNILQISNGSTYFFCCVRGENKITKTTKKDEKTLKQICMSLLIKIGQFFQLMTFMWYLSEYYFHNQHNSPHIDLQQVRKYHFGNKITCRWRTLTLKEI